MGLKTFLSDVFLGRSRAADLKDDPFLRPWKRPPHCGAVLSSNPSPCARKRHPPASIDFRAPALAPAPDMREALQAANKRTLDNLNKTPPGERAEFRRSPILAGLQRDDDGWAKLPERAGYWIREAPGGFDYRTPEGVIRDGFDTMGEACAYIDRDIMTRTTPYEGHRHHKAKASAPGAPWPKTPPAAPHDEHKAYPGKSSAYSTQVGGNHYAKLPVQPFEFSFANGWDGGAHSILKYVSRFEDKGGKEDLKKALHIAELRQEALATVGPRAPAVTIPTPWHDPISMQRYCELNRYHGYQKQALLSLELWVMNPTISKHYADLRQHLHRLIEDINSAHFLRVQEEVRTIADRIK